MSLKVITDAGKPLCITDREDGKEEFFIIDDKQYTEQELRSDKKLFDRFNDDVKQSNVTVDLND